MDVEAVCSTSGTALVTLRMEVAGYQPLRIGFLKTCLAGSHDLPRLHPAGSVPPPDSHWGPMTQPRPATGSLLLTVVVAVWLSLVLLAYGAFALRNYRQGVRGWRILPLVETAIACFRPSIRQSAYGTVGEGSLEAPGAMTVAALPAPLPPAAYGSL
ncbi:hypothetical protein PAPYR_6993 [Paratrimastix pyriformis]|uniref:Uncharacterized protein n=1 Tax=Paratrimastix pyriformis TaxID=342808 RepID=A0ABQ8UHZ0_9EUKA|nr:hypothetical protein PAPYR_6993 [Paratrimastix pyriformis]